VLQAGLGLADGAVTDFGFASSLRTMTSVSREDGHGGSAGAKEYCEGV